MIENEMGPEAIGKMTQMGMPSDKYEAALMYYQMNKESRDSRQMFLDEFYFGVNWFHEKINFLHELYSLFF